MVYAQPVTLVPRPFRALALAAAVILTSSCSTTDTQGGSAASPSASASATSPAYTGVVKATHPQCDLGPKILHYLITGDNGGDPQLDVAFSQHVGAPEPQARSIADQYVQQCDARIDRQASESAKVQTETSADPKNATQDAATRDITQAAACDAIGGRVEGTLCHSTIQASPGGPGLNCSDATIAFNADGNIDPAVLADANKQLPGCFR